MSRVLYLNNSGSRMIVVDSQGNKEKQEFTTKSGRKVSRIPIYWEMWGNFSCCLINYKGKRISVFPDTLLED